MWRVARAPPPPLAAGPQPFIGAARLDFGEITTIDGTPTRGAIVSCTVRVRAAPALAARHASGLARTAEHDGDGGGAALHPSGLPVATFAVRLQQQRRPPLQGAWLVTDLIDAGGVASNRPL